MGTGELGSWLAVTDGIGGCVSIWLSGFITSRFDAKNARAKTLLLSLASLLVIPLALRVLWCPSKNAALGGYLLLNLPMLFYMAPTAALVQDLVGMHMRATMASIFFLIQMILGAVIANQLVGTFSDVLTSLTGNAGVGLAWSMTLGSMAAFGAALYYWLAGRSVQRDLEFMRAGAETSGTFGRAAVPIAP